MKSNKGFTLIELLAVIVILAIIALIATPTILGVIETARKGSAESSALGYIDAVEKQIAIDMLDQTTPVVNLPTTNGEIAAPTVSVKGQAPKPESKITVDVSKGTITSACLIINLNNKDYYVYYDGANGSAKVDGNDSCKAAA